MKDERAFRFARIALAAAALAASAAVAPASAQVGIKLSLDGRIEGPAAPFLLPIDRGYYKSEGLDVTVEPSANSFEPITRVAAGSFELGVVDINALIRYRDQHPATSVKAVFIVHNKPALAVIARKSRGIAKPKDLEGKRIGAPASDPAHALWPVFAKLNEIDTGKVTLENVGVAVREPMLAAGQVDAVTGYSYNSYVSVKDRGVAVDDLVVMLMGDHGLKAYGLAIIVNSKFAADKPDAVKAFLRAFVRGLRDTIKDPGRAVESVIKRDELTRKEVELERLRIAIRDNFVTPEVRTHGLGAADMARLTESIAQIGAVAKFKTKVNAADIFDAAYLPPLADRRAN
jgi:NitT/TauT family transport system substrate-binding protein